MASRIDRSRTKSAMNKVIDIPEILEMILAQMDMRTLLTSAHRVCRNWANLISKSPSIQKALFFTPIKDSEWGKEENIPNPLLTETFPSFFTAKDRPDRYQFDFSNLPMTKDALSMARFVREDASWRKMLVQQPPLLDIGLFHICHARGNHNAESSSIPADKKIQQSGHDGLRMERLFELLLFSDEVKFLSYTQARVYWSTEEPILFDESFQKINDEFHRMMSKFGLVLCTRELKQYPMRTGPSSPEEPIREDIITAYTEHGFDVDLKKKEIQESTVEGSDLCCCSCCI